MQSRHVVGQLGRQTVEFVSKPGLPAWDQISPAAVLLGEHAVFPAGARALLFGSGHGALAAQLAPRLAALWITDTSVIAREMSAKTLELNQVHNVTWWEGLELPAELAGQLDVALVELPKGRKLAQRWLAQAWQALRADGVLYLAGANDQGIQSVIKDAVALFGAGAVLDYKKGNRVARFHKRQPPAAWPAWFAEPGIAPGTWQTFDLDVFGRQLSLRSLPGVFASEQLDAGTGLLLSVLEVSAGERVVDLGCGYGLIGLLAAQAGAQVDLVDANLLAVACAQANLQAYGLQNGRAQASDVLAAVNGRRYRQVLSNPPFHAGKAVDLRLAQAFMEQSWAALEPGGRLLLVANRFLRYQPLLERWFGQVARRAENNQYVVLEGVKG